MMRNKRAKRGGCQRPNRKSSLPHDARPHPASYQEAQKGLSREVIGSSFLSVDDSVRQTKKGIGGETRVGKISYLEGYASSKILCRY